MTRTVTVFVTGFPEEASEILRSGRADAAESRDIFFLYSDGVYDGSDKEERQRLESVMREHCLLRQRKICNALLEYAVKRTTACGRLARKIALTTKTVFIIKRN